MHPPILRCLVPGAQPAVGPMAEPGQIAPVLAVVAIETLVAYLRSVDPRREDRRTWDDFVVDNSIFNNAVLARCADALAAGRRAAHARSGAAKRDEATAASSASLPKGAPWQLRLRFDA